MKIRQGFVSNSSSSSFVAVYVDDSNIIKRFMKKFGYNEEDVSEYEYEEHEDFKNVDYGIMEHVPTNLHLHASCGHVYWIGLDIEDLLSKDMRVSECKDIVRKMFDNIGIKFDTKKLKFESGTCGSG